MELCAALSRTGEQKLNRRAAVRLVQQTVAHGSSRGGKAGVVTPDEQGHDIGRSKATPPQTREELLASPFCLKAGRKCPFVRGTLPLPTPWRKTSNVTGGSGTHTVRTRDLTGMTLVFLECFPRSYLPPIHRPQRLKAPFLSLPTSVTSFAQMAHTLSSPTPSSFSSSLLRSSCVPVASSC